MSFLDIHHLRQVYYEMCYKKARIECVAYEDESVPSKMEDYQIVNDKEYHGEHDIPPMVSKYRQYINKAQQSVDQRCEKS